MGTVLWLLGGFSLAYYFVIVVYAGISADFAWFWFCLAAVSFLLGAVARADQSKRFIPAAGKTIALTLAGIILLVFLILLGQVIYYMHAHPPKGMTYAVVLGAQVTGDQPSRSLQRRLDTAISYAENNPETKLILSGGQGNNEDISEAECMRRYLAAHGISEKRMILEDKSVNTRENLKFSDSLTGCSTDTVGIVTNDFHICRSLRLARKLGYGQVYGIPASSDPVLEVHFTVREVFALIKEKVRGQI